MIKFKPKKPIERPSHDYIGEGIKAIARTRQFVENKLSLITEDNIVAIAIHNNFSLGELRAIWKRTQTDREYK